MKARQWFSSAGVLAAIAGVLAVLAAKTPEAMQPAEGSAGVPGFIHPGHCYRFTFAITGGTPNWKVLATAGEGWVRGEIDAGSARAERETVWINTRQILTAREARCSD